jgi:hypothetical protein
MEEHMGSIGPLLPGLLSLAARAELTLDPARVARSASRETAGAKPPAGAVNRQEGAA